MQQDILIIGVLFPAIPLMMVNFGNRYTVLANLIRHLHDEVIRDNVSPKDAERFLLQISPLRNRLRLIGIIQSCAAISFVLALGAMIVAYFDERVVSSILFLGSIQRRWARCCCSPRTRSRTGAGRMSDLETHQEWEQYPKPKRRRRAATRNRHTRRSQAMSGLRTIIAIDQATSSRHSVRCERHDLASSPPSSAAFSG